VGQPTAATAFVGIDVAKATLGACLLLPGRKARVAAFANDPAGHAALIAWADRHAGGLPAHFCLEATGPYSEPPATALADAGRHVRVANPARVKAHAAASGQGNKTDPADACAVAEFARDRRPPAWQPRHPGGVAGLQEPDVAVGEEVVLDPLLARAFAGKPPTRAPSRTPSPPSPHAARENSSFSCLSRSR
jgi:hypothetical protein